MQASELKQVFSKKSLIWLRKICSSKEAKPLYQDFLIKPKDPIMAG
jgi:hypothetical protein